MKRNSIPVFWMGMAFGVALGLAAVVLAIEGIDAKSLRMGLRVTARWAFLLFWMAYAGRAMATLFGPAFAPLARRGREFGLAYAAAMLIHVGLLVWLFQLTSRAPLSGSSLPFFLIGIVWTYVLALFSFGRLVEALGPTGWRILRIVGLNYILLAFASDFVPAMIHHGTARYEVWRLVAYAPFAAMSVAAPLLVLAATAHRRLGIRDHPPNSSYVANMTIITTAKIIAYSVLVGLLAARLRFFAFIGIPPARALKGRNR